MTHYKTWSIVTPSMFTSTPTQKEWEYSKNWIIQHP